MFDRGCREVRAFAQFGNQTVRLLADLIDLRQGHSRRDLQQDVAEAILVGDRLPEPRRCKQFVDVAFRDDDLTRDDRPLDPVDRHVAANPFAQRPVGVALRGHVGDELLQRHVVPSGEFGDRPGEGFVVHFDAAHLRLLELDALGDELLENLLPQCADQERVVPLRLVQSGQPLRQAILVFTRQHDVVVYDGDDAVESLSRGCRSVAPNRAQENGSRRGRDAPCRSELHRYPFLAVAAQSSLARRQPPRGR